MILVLVTEKDTAITTDLQKLADARLVSQVLSGDESAFRELVRRYERPVVNLIARMVRDPGMAEDLGQETFLKAFGSLAAFDARRRFSSWLFRIAHNTALDALRRPRLDTVSLDRSSEERGEWTPPDLSTPTPAERAESAALARALDAALSRLRREYREAIVLRHHEGLSYEEVGDVMGVPEGTAKTYVHRGRRELAGLLAAAGWRPPS